MNKIKQLDKRLEPLLWQKDLYLSKESDTLKELHKKAIESAEDSYIDPKTGFVVFTETYHLKRGYCCKSGCRHCPYEKDSER